MCLPMDNRSAHEAGCDYLVTAGWISDLTRYRNTMEGDDCLTIMGSRLAGAMGYPVLALAALVECAVRLAFHLISLVPAALCICCDGGAFFEGTLRGMANLPVWGVDIVLRCAIGFFKNLYEHELDFQKLTFGQCCYEDDVRTDRVKDPVFTSMVRGRIIRP